MKTMRKPPHAIPQAIDHTMVGAPERCGVPGADEQRVANARDALLDQDLYTEIAETFRALADATRVKIVYSLLNQELCTCDLATIVGTSESAVSQHLRTLRQLRLIRSRRDGKMVFHSLDDTHIYLLLSVCLSHVRDVTRQHEGLEHIVDFFDRRLSAATQDGQS